MNGSIHAHPVHRSHHRRDTQPAAEHLIYHGDEDPSPICDLRENADPRSGDDCDLGTHERRHPARA